ncbi:MAG: class I SAM-dependent methyltransferase [Rhodospirillales bacterium]
MTSDFYQSYSAFKAYETPGLSTKDVARFDDEIWGPGGFDPDMRVLELGSGTGQFLLYLHTKGVRDFTGIDHDPELLPVAPEPVRDRLVCADVNDWLAGAADGLPFDRIVLLDVLEHFTPADGLALLRRLSARLAPEGRIVVKVPNAGSPWGLTYQFGDLTHLMAFNSTSLGQLAVAAGLTVERIYDQHRGSRRRRFTDAAVRRFLGWALLTPPPLWGANLYGVFSACDSR